MSTAKRVIKNTGFLYAKMGITMFISLYTTRLVLNSLGASDFGVFNVVGGAIAMLGFLNTAMASATQRFMSYSEGEGNKEKQKQIFNISFVLHLMIGLFLGLILMIAGYFFFNGILNIEPERIFAAKVVYGSLIVSTMFTVMTVPYDAVLNARENMLYYSIVGIIESLLKLSVAIIIVYYAGDKLILYGILMAIIPIVIMLIMRIYCHFNYEECTLSFRKYWDKSLMKEMTRFAGWNFLGNASKMIMNYGHGLIINIFFGVIANTSQGIANQLTGQLNNLTVTMMKALNPVIAKSEGSGNRDQMIKFTIVGSKISILLMILIFVPFWVEMSFILNFWLKKVPTFTIIFCRLLLINTIIGYSILPVITSISAHGNIKKFEILSSILNFFPLIVIYFLYLNDFPVYYSYIVFSIQTIMTNFITLFIANKNYNFPIKVFLKNVILKPILILVMMLSISYLIVSFLDEGLFRFLFVLCFSTFTFMILLITVGLEKNEKVIVYNIFNFFTLKIKNIINYK